MKPEGRGRDAPRTSPWLLAAAVLLAFYWMLGSVPLYDLDEGAFTEATREMLAGGNYITPHRDGEPRYDKPILIYWLQAASVAALGLDEFALRLPSALAATAWLLALWFFVRDQLDAATATVAALVMALTFEVSIIAKAATADALLNLFLALALFEIYRWYAWHRYAGPRDGPGGWILLRAYWWMGLGFLTKGPLAVFFPFVVSLLFFVSQRALGDWLRAVSDPRGWALFLAVTVPWHLAIYWDSGAGFFESFFLRHNLGRFGAPMQGHEGFPGYYLAVLPLILLPFTGWFLRLLPAMRRGWADPLDRFLWLWFAVVLVVFSFSGTKLPHYLLYGATPLFVLMARHRDLLTRRWLAFLPPLLFFGLLFFLPEVLQWAAGRTDKPHQLAQFELGLRLLDLPYRLVVLTALFLVAGIALWRRLLPWQGLVLAAFVQMAVVSGLLIPRVMATLQGPVKEAALLARSLDLPTVVYRTSMPSFSLYRQAITPDRDPRPGDLVFLRIDKIDRLGREHPELAQEEIFRRGAVALIKVTAGQGGG